MITRWEIRFRGNPWEIHTVSSGNRDTTETTMGHALAEAKRKDPRYADDYTLAEVTLPSAPEGTRPLPVRCWGSGCGSSVWYRESDERYLNADGSPHTCKTSDRGNA